MRVCEVLSALYGKDTRSAQTLNVVVAAWWGFVMCPGSEWLSILHLPTALLNGRDFVFGVSLAILLSAITKHYTTGRVRQTIKVFSLLFGTMLTMVVANAYVARYPPIDVMMVVNFILCLYIFGAVWFVFRCEGIYGGS